MSAVDADATLERGGSGRRSRRSATAICDLDTQTIERIRQQGVTVLLVKQNTLAALEIADYGYVLESGRLNLQGPAERLLNEGSVAAAYLGGSDVAAEVRRLD